MNSLTLALHKSIGFVCTICVDLFIKLHLMKEFLQDVIRYARIYIKLSITQNHIQLLSLGYHELAGQSDFYSYCNQYAVHLQLQKGMKKRDLDAWAKVILF